MNLCLKNKKKWFGLISLPSQHFFLITNCFYTLENRNKIDVVKTCQACGIKESLSMDWQTLVEVAHKFPNAFTPLVRDYVISWTL
jgi:hypothetical protein